MANDKGVALAILGIVAVIAVVGLVLLFSQAKTGNLARGGYLGQGGVFAGQFDTISGKKAAFQAMKDDPLKEGRDTGLETERAPSEGGARRLVERISPNLEAETYRPAGFGRASDD